MGENRSRCDYHGASAVTLMIQARRIRSTELEAPCLTNRQAMLSNLPLAGTDSRMSGQA
jgi:hypothetical protein